MVCVALVIVFFWGGTLFIEAVRDESRSKTRHAKDPTSESLTEDELRTSAKILRQIKNEIDPDIYVCERNWFEKVGPNLRSEFPDLRTSVHVFASLLQEPGIQGKIALNADREYVWTIKQYHIEKYPPVDAPFSHLRDVVLAFLGSFQTYNQVLITSPSPLYPNQARAAQYDERAQMEQEERENEIPNEEEVWNERRQAPRQRAAEYYWPKVTSQGPDVLSIRSKSLFLAIKVFWCILGKDDWATKRFELSGDTLKVWWEKRLDYEHTHFTKEDQDFILACYVKMLDRMDIVNARRDEEEKIDQYFEQKEIEKDRVNIFIEQAITIDRNNKGKGNIFGV